MTTLQALKILKTEFEALNIPQKDGSFKSLMQLEDVLIQIVKELKPEVRRFVNAQNKNHRYQYFEYQIFLFFHLIVLKKIYKYNHFVLKTL